MLLALLHDFRPGHVRCFAAGGFPCCCAPEGSSTAGSSGSQDPPQGSSSPTVPSCDSCQHGLIARYYQVELTGIEQGIPGCDECETLNGVYIVEITRTEPTACYGAIPIDGACTDEFDGGCYRELRLSFGAVDATWGVPVWVTLGPRPGDEGPGECTTVTSIMWRKYLSQPGEPLACLELDHEELPFDNRTGFVEYCDAGSSTAYLTAL